MMIFVAPSAWIRSWASRLVPSPTASIEITAATPKTIPRTVRPERSLCSSRLFIPSFRPRQMRLIAASLLFCLGRAAGRVGAGPAVLVSGSAVVGGVAAERGGLGLHGGARPGAGAVVDDQAVAHPDDPLGVLGDVVLVGDQDDRLARVVEPAEHVHDLVARLGVEVAGRLVGQDDVGVVDQRAGDRHPLLLAAGE